MTNKKGKEAERQRKSADGGRERETEAASYFKFGFRNY